MKNVYEVLQQKQREAERLRREIMALRLATPLLADVAGTALPSEAAPPSQEQIRQWKEALSLAAPLLADEADDLASTLRARNLQTSSKGRWEPVLKIIGLSPFRL